MTLAMHLFAVHLLELAIIMNNPGRCKEVKHTCHFVVYIPACITIWDLTLLQTLIPEFVVAPAKHPHVERSGDRGAFMLRPYLLNNAIFCFVVFGISEVGGLSSYPPEITTILF